MLSNSLGNPLPDVRIGISSDQGHDVEAETIGRDGDPWDEEAIILKRTIATLAGIDESEVDTDVSILELGLDSIEVIKLSSRLRQHHGIEIPVSSIMQNPTIRKIQKILRNYQSASLKEDRDVLADYEHIVRQVAPDLDGKGISAVYPCTPLQEAMVAEALTSDYARYFNHDVLKLEPWVDVQRLRRAWNDVIKANDILRTYFVSCKPKNGQRTFSQVVQKFSNDHWHEVEVDSSKSVTNTIDSIMQKTTQSADILGDPPVYLTLVKAWKSTNLILSISHALYDGWSIGLLHEDLKRAYFDALLPRPSARLMIEKIFESDMAESQTFWNRILNGVVASKFPESFPEAQGSVQTHCAEKKSSLKFAEIHAFCKNMGVTVPLLGQACWAMALAHYLGETDVVFGNVLSGRDFDQADEIMFPAMNTVPVRAVLRGSCRNLISLMQEDSSATLKHQHTPLREIQRLLNMNGVRLFDTVFLYQREKKGIDSDANLYKSVGGASEIEVCILVLIIC
jgi:aryl carrier-like protein